MNESRILAAYGDDDALSAHLLEAARRLERIVASELTAIIDGLALQFIATVHSVRFRDGFAINDCRSMSSTIGWREASAIVAAVTTNHDASAQWWNNERFEANVASPQFDAACKRLMDHIRAHPDVAGVD